MLTPLAQANGEAILPLEDAKAHLRVRDTSEDATIERLRDDAIDFVESYSSVALSVRDFRWDQDGFTSTIRLPIWPANSVSAVSYLDPDGVDTAMADGGWHFGRGSVMAAIGTTWPAASSAPGSVRVTFSAGYALAADIPPMLLSGVKLALTALFEDRSNPDFSGAMRCCDRHRGLL